MTYRILEVRDKRRRKKVKRFIAQRRLFWPFPWRDIASTKLISQAYQALCDYVHGRNPRSTHFNVRCDEPSLIRYE